MTDKSIYSIRIKLIAFFFMLLVTVILAEIILRVYNPIHVPLRANKIVLPVRTHYVYKNTANPKVDPIIHNTYNSLGFRGSEPPENFDNHLTLLTVGGSTTACVGLSDGKTWPDLMEKNLQSRLPNFWLNNAGFDGHSTFGHLQLLNQVIKDIHPDYILYLVGVNEIGRKDLNTFDAGLDPENLSLRNKIIMKSELLSTIQVLSRTLRAIKLGNNHMPDMDFSQQEKFEISDVRVLQLLTLHRNEFLPEYRNRLSKLLNETIAAGIVPIIATQPAIWGDVRDPTLKIPLGPLMFVDGIDSSTQWKIMNLYNSVTKEEAKSNGVQVIDLGNLMPKDTRYFYDWVHYSNEGAEVVATILANKIFPILESSLKAKTTH